MKKINIIILILLTSIYINSQIPVTDVAANANLVIINTQLATLIGTIGALEVTAASTEVSTGTQLTETVAQGEAVLEQYEELAEIQEALKTVTTAIKSVSSVRKSIELSFKTTQDFLFIINNVDEIEMTVGNKTLKIFNQNNIDRLNQEFDDMVENNTHIVELISELVQDNVFKMEEGNRLQLLLELQKSLMKNYNFTHQKRLKFEKLFGKYINTPING